jgi:glycosyltransferase involved in cell wall biosynthesis
MQLHPTLENPLPPGAECLELVTADEVRLRALRAIPGDARGTVVLLGGRGDFIERYFETAREILARGFAVAGVDMRGQGGSQRHGPDVYRDVTTSFTHFEEDLRTLMDGLVLPTCPPPYYALGHSTGAHILLRILPNSVAPAFFDGHWDGSIFRETHGLGGGPLFLCVANYSTRKNQQLALRAFAEAAVPAAALVFIGSEVNEHSRALEELAGTLPLAPGTTVRVLAGLSRADTIAAFHDAHAFVLSATEETQPFVLLEAMAAGLPFVSTPTGCVDEMPGGITAGTSAEIAQAMRMLASDPALHAKLRAEGLKFARANCSRDRSVDLMEEIIGVRQEGERTVRPA